MASEPVPQTQAVRLAVNAALREGFTQARVAQQAGLSSAALSAWLRGSYRGDCQAVQRRLTDWIATRQTQDAPAAEAALETAGPSWVATPTGEKIERALNLALKRTTVAVVYGGAGVGKTTALRRFAASVPHVWIVTASPAIATVSAVLREVAATLELAAGYQNRSLSRDIRRALAGLRALLIVDEAQHLSLSALEELRAIHDGAGVGLVLSGNEMVYARLTGHARRADFAQLFSRVGRRVRLGLPSTEDVAAILTAWGIRGTKEAEFAQQIACLPGGLRNLAQVLDDSATMAAGMGKPADLGLMRAAWAELGVAA